MSTTSKNQKTLSASSFIKLVNKHAMRAKSTKKTSGTSRHTRIGNLELETVPGQHNVLSDQTVTAEDYTIIVVLSN